MPCWRAPRRWGDRPGTCSTSWQSSRGRAELWLLEAVAGDRVSHLDACLVSGILCEDGDAVAFRHELARLAVESAIPAARRRTLHHALAGALATPRIGSRDLSRLAHHAEEAGDVAAVLEYAQGAGRIAAAGAHREAADQYARALATAVVSGKRSAPSFSLRTPRRRT